MKIHCVTIGKYMTAQGTLVAMLPGGRAIVDTGKSQVTGDLVRG